jgi:glycosyltransferase involved in cell wall biosynthesis
MRIVIVTAGTGSFYCGTCMRDNALAVALRDQGHDAILVPLYLPPSLDEPSATENSPLFYGGVNVYLQQSSGLFRHTPRWVDRVFDSPGMLRMAANRAGSTQAKDLGELTVSTLRGEDGNQAKELDRLIEWLISDFKPDVVCLSNALLMGLAESIKTRTGAALFCTLQGEDAFLDSLPDPHREEAWRLLSEGAQKTDGLIAVSNYHANLMMERARLPKALLHVVYNGIRLDGYGPRPVSPDPPVIGYLARMCQAKGLDDLVDSFILLRKRGSRPTARLRMAGSVTASDQPFVDALKERLRQAGLESESEFLPNVSREDKIRFLRGLTVLSVPATYGESFGLYLIEAWAAGVPVVQPRHAVFPELILFTGAGLLYEPDDAHALADRLQEILADPARAEAMGEKGREAVLKHFTAEAMARQVLNVFTSAGREQTAAR